MKYYTKRNSFWEFCAWGVLTPYVASHMLPKLYGMIFGTGTSAAKRVIMNGARSRRFSIAALLRYLADAGWGVLSLYIVRFIYERKDFLRKVRSIPNNHGKEPPHPILGSIPHMVPRFAAGTMNNEWKKELHNEFGDTLVQIVGPIWVRNVNIGITHPKDVEWILSSNFKNYIKPENLIMCLRDFLGKGIFAVNHAHTPDNGQRWMIQRKTASKIFTGRNFRGMFFKIFVNHGKKVLRIMEDASEAGGSFDAQRIMFNFTLDSIGQIGFGADLGCLDGAPSEFALAFDKAQHYSVSRFVDPLWPFKKIATRFLGVSIGREAKLKQSCDIMRAFSRRFVDERKNDPDLESRKDILSLFMCKTNPDTGEKFDFEFLHDIIMSFFIAGRDTTACTLTFAMKLLAEHPDCQTKLYEEVVSEFGTNGEPDFDTLCNELPYLDAVIKETLRLYPPVPSDVKECVEDDVLPGSGYAIPGKTEVVFEPYAMGRSEALWGKDAESFNPDRWLGTKVGPPEDMFTFPVFQAGPRYCLGMRMALLEAKCLVAMVAQKFEVVLEPGQNFQFSSMITLSLLNGLQCSVTRRQAVGEM